MNGRSQQGGVGARPTTSGGVMEHLAGVHHQLRPVPSSVRSRHVLAMVVATFVVSLGATGSAQVEPTVTTKPAVSDEQIARARELFAEGLGFVEAEQWEQAADRFSRVQAIRSSPVVSYNLGSALFHLGHYVEAGEALRLALSDAGADKDVAAASRQLQAEIDAKLGHVTVELRGSHLDGLEVTVNGRSLSRDSWGIPMPVNPGTQRIEVNRGGMTVTTRELNVGGDDQLRVEVTIDIAPTPAQTAASAGPATASTTTEEPSDDDTLWWVVGGVGVAVLVSVGVAVAVEVAVSVGVGVSVGV